ncbi:MAG: glycosyltransferase family 4 protein [Patescibacteria group bacterium]|nr:glycosyltransferase family 4 protein [Patescibacteria group bacterium]
MKIAHVICTFPPYKGGMGNSALNFALYTAKLKHNITIITPEYNRPTDFSFFENIIKVNRINPVFAYGNAAVLPVKKIDWDQFDIVHLHYPFYGTAEQIARLKRSGAKFKLIVHYHMDTHSGGWKGIVFNIYKRLYLKYILNSADVVTAASLDYIKHGDIADYYNQHQHKFIQVPFGVDASRFSPKADNDKKQILFVGGLDKAHYFKGVTVLLKAFAASINKLPEYKLIIVGKGNLLDDYKNLSQKLGLGDRVIFENKVDDEKLAEIYQESSFLVLPSINTSEAFGLVLLEAMASGLPVIASNLPGVRSVFKNAEHGYVVKPGDIDDLAKKMQLLVSDQKRFQQMKINCRQLVEDRYTWESAAKKLNELYYRIKYAPIIED